MCSVHVVNVPHRFLLSSEEEAEETEKCSHVVQSEGCSPPTRTAARNKPAEQKRSNHDKLLTGAHFSIDMAISARQAELYVLAAFRMSMQIWKCPLSDVFYSLTQYLPLKTPVKKQYQFELFGLSSSSNLTREESQVRTAEI